MTMHARDFVFGGYLALSPDGAVQFGVEKPALPDGAVLHVEPPHPLQHSVLHFKLSILQSL